MDDTVTRARQGDQSAWRVLFERDREWLYNLAYRITLNREDALDVVQESFSRAFLNLAALSDERAWRGWLRTIATNTAIERARRAGKILKWFGQRVDDEDAQSVPTRLSSARNEAHFRELHSAFTEALRDLSPQQRAVAVLHFEHDLTGMEIAESLGLQIGSVKSHLFRARKSLQKKLAGFLEGGAL